MATYVTKKCPHCGFAYQFMYVGEQRKYGCPLQTCLKCKNQYWDTDIKEPALHGYVNIYEIKKILFGIIFCTIFLLGAIVFSGAGVYLLYSGEYTGALAFVIGGIFVWSLVSIIKRIIKAIKYKDSILFDRQKAYDASKARLKDTNYLTALAERDLLARKLLKKRTAGAEEHYANRPK